MEHPLKRLRDSLGGVTQQALAAALDIAGLDGDKISKIERGIRDLSRREAIRLVDVYGPRAREAADFISAHGLAESEVGYIGSGSEERHAPTLATLLYPQGRADTMIVNSRSLVLEGYVPGCRILVDRDCKPRDGDVVVIQVNGDQTDSAKMLLRIYKPPHLVPAALSRDFPPFVVGDERIDIMAVVVARYKPAAAEPKARKKKRPAPAT